jgi:energy-coupling factor transport system permease protein
MLVTWRYRFRNSVIEKFDPRARWFASFAILFALIQFWDFRFIIFFFGLSMLQFFLTKLTWKETKRTWMMVTLLVVVIIGINTLLTGRGGSVDVMQSQAHIITQWDLRIFKVTFTSEKLMFAITQIFRMLAIAVMFFIIPWTMDPQKYGVTFSGMGLPYKAAFSMDLAFRFVPSLARDFQITLDAQRARGYQINRVEGGFIQTVQRIAPLIIPLIMNSIVNGEDIINAMDLRCFGVLKERTWIEKLTYQTKDYFLIGFGVAILIASTILTKVYGIGTMDSFFVFDIILKLAK